MKTQQLLFSHQLSKKNAAVLTHVTAIKNLTMANLLKIATTVTETKSVEKEITLPYYFENEHGGFIYKVVSDKYAIQVCTFNEHLGTCLCPSSLFKERLAKGTPISEFEFDAAYQKAMMYVDLINRNEEPLKEEDENVQIDEILYDQR